MIRYKESTTYEDGKVHAELSLASTDAKPTDGIATGSVCVEANTGKTFLYDESTQTWNEVSTGGGGGGSESLIIDAIYDEIEDISTLNKTWQEIYDAYIGGTMCIIREEPGSGSARLTSVQHVIYDENFYQVESYSTDSPNGYPNDGDGK